jgi:hypothetical protein
MNKRKIFEKEEKLKFQQKINTFFFCFSPHIMGSHSPSFVASKRGFAKIVSLICQWVLGGQNGTDGLFPFRAQSTLSL